MAKIILVLLATAAAVGGTTVFFRPGLPDHPGLALARNHCVRCHLLPRPEDLPREKWPFAIDWMANYLGHRKTDGPFEAIVDTREIPEWKAVSAEGLQQIRQYYVSHSLPQDSLTPSRKDPEPGLVQFRVSAPKRSEITGAITTLLHVDKDRGRLYAGFADTRNLQVTDRTGAALFDAPLPSAPVAVLPLPSGFRLTLMGDFERDRGHGCVVDVSETGRVRPVLEGYHRLAGSRTADLDADGKPDLVLAGFGDFSDGRVSILWQESSRFHETILEERSGAVAVEVSDLDADGDQDLLVLLAQAHQELLIFRNDGNRTFHRIVAHKKRAGFGYNHLSLGDFNRDGRMDVVTSAGNNMEMIDPPLRPGHGIRVLLNQGGLGFEEAAFLPLHGALKTLARDFDGDGDLDLASIAFYPDWSLEHPTTFVHYENTGDLSFVPRTLPARHWGRWMALDAGDIDGNGTIDIVLGSARLTAGVPTRRLDGWRSRLNDQPVILTLLNRRR